jgi:hypothetical protein
VCWGGADSEMTCLTFSSNISRSNFHFVVSRYGGEAGRRDE